MLSEVPGEGIEQLGIGRRIGIADVVLGFDEPAFEEMFPITIHQRFRQKGIGLLTHPIRQAQPGIIIRRDFQGGSTQRSGFHRQPRFLVLRLGDAPLVKYQILPGSGSRLAAHLCEKSRQAVIVPLAPAFERVMVALRTLHSHSQKQLRHVLHLLIRFLDALIPGHGRVVHDGAGRGKQLPHHFVIRLVGEQAVANP